MNESKQMNDNRIRCDFCGYYHLKMAVYVEKNAQLIKKEETFLIECTNLGESYLLKNQEEIYV